ncbi:peptidase [Streptosporangium violaceochromogenes]|nr:peptidase [Streptosporangium violaceochromogenes]
MTSSLPLLAGAALVTTLAGVPAPASIPGPGPAVAEHARTAGAPARRAGTIPGPRTTPPQATSPRAVDVAERPAVHDPSTRRRALAYWTPRRMAAAVPIGSPGTAAGAPGGSPPAVRHRHGRALGTRWTAGARWTGGGQVTRTTGRVFLTLAGADFVCSASSVKSASRDLVVTAGHCVKDGAGAWADNWVFVPGYDRGRRPYGQFTARRMFVAGPWARGADDGHDLGMVAVGPRGGKHLGEIAGAQEIAFGTPSARPAHGFGFPAEAPYDGERLVYCSGPLRGDPHGHGDRGLRCDMTAGASGGPWLSDFDPATGRGTITSVSSFKYSDDRGTMYGPAFGETARRLYAVAQIS